MKKDLIVKQEEFSDCGACSLLSIIRYYNGNASLEEIRVNSLTSYNGVTALNLIKCANYYGFNASGLHVDSLNNLKLPLIVHLKINNSLSHFAVLYSIKGERYTLMDPAIGKRILNKSEFYKIFTGNVILLYPYKKIENIPVNNIFQNKVNKFVFQNKRKILSILLLIIIYSILDIVFSMYIQFQSRNINKIILSFFIIITAFKSLIKYFIDEKILKCKISFNMYITNMFFNHLFKLPIKYLQFKGSGEIVRRIEDLDILKDMTIELLFSIISNFIITSSTLICLYIFSKNIFILTLLFIIPLIIILWIIKVFYRNNMNSVIMSQLAYSSTYVDKIKGIVSIKNRKGEEYAQNSIKNNFNSYLKEVSNYNMKLSKLNNCSSCIYYLIILFFNTILLYYLNKEIINNLNFIVINFIFSGFLSSIFALIINTPQIFFIKKIIIKINEFFLIKEENLKPQKSLKFSCMKINSLNYSYNLDKQIITNLNFNINKGDRILIKGISGSGKSTLCKTIIGEISDYNGNIKYNNQEISKIKNYYNINNISYSSQSEYIFTDTIRNNITMGHEYDEKKLDEIIKLCHIDNFINKLPHGIDTYLYCAGEELSGGERQLIVLARALIQDNDIYIFDESLSEVSSDIEDNIIESLNKKLKDKTIIYISHKNKEKYFSRIINM